MIFLFQPSNNILDLLGDGPVLNNTDTSVPSGGGGDILDLLGDLGGGGGSSSGQQVHFIMI